MLSSVCEYAKVGYHNGFSKAFVGSIKATDSSNDQKSLLETKCKRTHLSFAVISLKQFLEDLSRNVSDCEIAVNMRTLLA